MKKQSFTPFLSVLFCSCILLLNPATRVNADQVVQNGVFSTIYGDAFTQNSLPQERYFLSTDSGNTLELIFMPGNAPGTRKRISLNGSLVQVIGEVDPTRRTSGPQQLKVAAIEAVDSDARIMPEAAAIGAQPWVTIMCKFSDVSTEPRDLNYFSNMYSSSYPGMDHYWREASYNRVNIAGSSAHGWFTLPHPRSYYVNNNTLNFETITTDCTAVADQYVYFPSYVGINLMFNDDLDGYAWGGSRYINIDGQGKSYRVTWEPPWGYTSITVIAHEMGHGFGMPHSSGNYGQTYDNVWDVMSNAWANCGNATNPTYGCLGQQTIGYHRELVGWLHANEIFTYQGQTRVITLERLTKPASNSYLLAKIPIKGSSTKYYTVEVRKRVGYDVKLASEAVIIHEVDEHRSNRRDAYLVDIDGNGNTGDAGAIWTVGEKFINSADSVCVEILAKAATSFTVKIGCPPQSQPKPVIAPLLHLLSDS